MNEIKVGDKVKLSNGQVAIVDEVTKSGYIWIKFKNGKQRLVWPSLCKVIKE